MGGSLAAVSRSGEFVSQRYLSLRPRVGDFHVKAGTTS
jgi:hypothetical protein